jgi:DNA-binding XRE family transcriptional regulator
MRRTRYGQTRSDRSLPRNRRNFPVQRDINRLSVGQTIYVPDSVAPKASHEQTTADSIGITPLGGSLHGGRGWLYFVAFYIILHSGRRWCHVKKGEPSMSTRAEDLRSLRLQKRLTQAEVAKKFKVSQSYYSSIENGNKPREVAEAEQVVNRMRTRTDRTDGGGQKAGREKS